MGVSPMFFGRGTHWRDTHATLLKALTSIFDRIALLSKSSHYPGVFV